MEIYFDFNERKRKDGKISTLWVCLVQLDSLFGMIIEQILSSFTKYQRLLKNGTTIKKNLLYFFIIPMIEIVVKKIVTSSIFVSFQKNNFQGSRKRNDMMAGDEKHGLFFCIEKTNSYRLFTMRFKSIDESAFL